MELATTIRKFAGYTKPRYGIPYITEDLLRDYDENTWFTGQLKDIINFANPKALLAATVVKFFSDDIKTEISHEGEQQPLEIEFGVSK